MGDVGVPASRPVSWKKSRDALGMPRSSTLRTLVLKTSHKLRGVMHIKAMCTRFVFDLVLYLLNIWSGFGFDFQLRFDVFCRMLLSALAQEYVA